MSHVALLIPTVDRIGGAERQVLLLAKGLRTRGWRVTVVALSGHGGDALANLEAVGAGFVTIEMRKGLADPRGWIRLARWLKKERPDILHAHLPHAAWMARWGRLLVPVRVVVDTLHSSSTGGLGRHWGYRVSDWLTDNVTAVGQTVSDAHVAAGMASPGKVSVVTNGVDTSSFRPDRATRSAVRNRLSMGEEFIWLAAGRLDAVKDYPTLLSAMTQVPPCGRLLIAGSGPLLDELRQLSTRFGLDSRVGFLGFEPDLRSWMQAADGFVLSSLWEGLPMGLLEAAACALPAVATDVPGTREAIGEGKTGWLTPAGDAAALARAMTTMMQIPAEERLAMGNRARQRVVKCNEIETVLDMWEDLYGALLKENTAPARWGRAHAKANAMRRIPG